MRALRVGNWARLTKVSGCGDNDELLSDVDASLERALRTKRVRRGSRSTDAATTPRRITIEKEKDDNEAPISAADNAKLSEVLRRKASNEITIEDAKLFLECVGNFICFREVQTYVM